MSIFSTAELEQLKDPVFFKVRYVKDLVNRMPVETIETPEALVMFVKVTCDDWIGWIYILVEFKFRYTTTGIFTYFLIYFLLKGNGIFTYKDSNTMTRFFFSFVKQTVKKTTWNWVIQSVKTCNLQQVKDKIVWFSSLKVDLKIIR